jgi:hypothetical protein
MIEPSHPRIGEPAELDRSAEEELKAMFMTEIKSVLTAVLVTGLALCGIGSGFGLSTNPVAEARTEPPNQPPAK